MNAIEIHQLTRDYGSGRGVFDVSITIKTGEAFGFLGPNGAGKTTTIRHLMGFLRPQLGTCRINGLDCWKDSAVIQSNLGYIPGEMSFFDDLRGDEFLDFFAKYRGSSLARSRSKELMERFEFDPSSKIKKMSKGTRQKLGIISAFMHDPEILLLDEPSSGLDPLMQNRFIDLVNEEK
ncbi:MAG: ABC transporter ATP-binding protein, partial [Clostridiales bacterium]|nr:ABC transporter ATP-binding protein [Clostridiales bacterium]